MARLPFPSRSVGMHSCCSTVDSFLLYDAFHSCCSSTALHSTPFQSRQIVSSGELPECGKYYVEEDEDEKDGGKGAVLRRLVFGRNQHVIQSEVRESNRWLRSVKK